MSNTWKENGNKARFINSEARCPGCGKKQKSPFYYVDSMRRDRVNFCNDCYTEYHRSEIKSARKEKIEEKEYINLWGF